MEIRLFVDAEWPGGEFERERSGAGGEGGLRGADQFVGARATGIRLASLQGQGNG